MKIECKVDADGIQMLRRFTSERARKIKRIDRKLDSLRKEVEAALASKNAVHEDESTGLSYILKPLGFLPKFGPSLQMNLTTGEVSWDDGQEDPEVKAKKDAEKKRIENKQLEEVGKDLAKGKNKHQSHEKKDAEIIPLVGADKNGG